MTKKSMLIIAILLMSIGFATISTTLILNGNAKVSENHEDFSVIFTAASIDGNDVYSTAVDDTKKTITFTTSELKTLNQTSVLNYEIYNNSVNYDANISINCVPKEGTTAKYTSIKNTLEDGVTIIKAKEMLEGTLTITLNKTSTEEVSEEYTCKLEFSAIERGSLATEPTQFQKDSWRTIAANVKSGNTSKYNVGDTKKVRLNGFKNHTVRIANKSECSNGETSETACGFIIEFADVISQKNMNSTPTNMNGWVGSELRTYINNDIYSSLPSDLQNIIVDTNVVSKNPIDNATTILSDKLYLLSVKEVWGSAKDDPIDAETKQLDYYKSMSVTISNGENAIKSYDGNNVAWWLRSASFLNSGSFYRVGGAGGEYDEAISTKPYGISPAFRIA